MPRYTLCPFYIDDNKLSISCEDTVRSFRELDQKNNWMDGYCDKSWRDCPHAMRISEAYDKQEAGDPDAVTRNSIDAMRAEVRSLSTQLGRVKRILDARDEEIRDLRRKNKRLSDLREQTYGDLRRLRSETDSKDAAQYRELQRMAQLYEDRLCYMIDTYLPDGLPEKTVEAWARGKEFALTHREGEERIWIAVKREVKDAGVLQEKHEQVREHQKTD